jgi:hypothetical protein
MEEFLTTRKEALLQTIYDKKSLDGTEADLKQAIEDFKSSWK